MHRIPSTTTAHISKAMLCAKLCAQCLSTASFHLCFGPTSETRESCKPGSVAQRVTALKRGPHLLDPGTVVSGIPRQEEAFGAHPRKQGRQPPFCTTSPPPPPPTICREDCSLARGTGVQPGGPAVLARLVKAWLSALNEGLQCLLPGVLID